MINKFLTKNPYFNDGKWITGDALRGFLLHSVGVGQPDPMVFVNKWNNENFTYAGINGFVGAGEIYLTAPCLDSYRRVKRMPHGGKPYVNDHYIGFEMTEPAQVHYTGSGAEFTCSDPDAARTFVRRTYDNAVALFALLCDFHGLDPLADGVILSHNEGRQRGIASGHVDPEHLWQGLSMDLTMDGFRRDVDRRVHPERYDQEVEIDMTKQELITLIDQRAQQIVAAQLKGEDTVPKWAEKEYQAAIAAGITDGSRPNARATRLESALMALRATEVRPSGE